MNSPKIRIAVLDSNPKSRKHLVKLLGKQPDISVVAETETGLAGIKVVEENKPDVILIDNNNPFTDGLETTEMIVSRFPDTRVIVLSMQSKSTMTASSCQTWACYPMCEKCSAKEILATIRDGFPGVKDAEDEIIL
jgi:DNA-binding NarL/FixJ family response regulator